MPSSNEALSVSFAGHTMLLDASGALFWPDEVLLVVSDLHLEKASFLTKSGSPLPPYDTADTLERLAALIARYRPARVVCLGDSFHDAKALLRLGEVDRNVLYGLISSVPQWHWLLGNHDVSLSADLPGQMHEVLSVAGIMLLHEPRASKLPQMVGHFHPKVRVALGGGKVSGPAFAHDERTFILPAFGSFTGGLDVRHEAIARHLSFPCYYLLYRNRIWKLRASLLSDF